MKSSKQLIVALVLGFGIGLVSVPGVAEEGKSGGAKAQGFSAKMQGNCKRCAWSCRKYGMKSCDNNSCVCNPHPGSSSGGVSTDPSEVGTGH